MNLLKRAKKNKDTDFDSLWKDFEQTKSKKIREKLIMEYLHLVKYSAGRIAITLPSYIELDDLFAAGLLGLIQAVEKYDFGRKIKFETYATPRIRGAMLDELRNQDWFPRSIRHKEKRTRAVMSKLETMLGRNPTDAETAEELNISMEEYYKWIYEIALTNLVSLDKNIASNSEGLYSIISELPNEKTIANNPYKALEEKELLNIIKETLNDMPEKESIVLTLYYYEEMTLKEIGMVMEVSESRICQIHTKALLRLKGRIARILKGVPGATTKGSIYKNLRPHRI